MPAVPRKDFDIVHSVAEAQLCNQALSRLGAELIQDTAEQSKQARIARELYASTRNEVLRTAHFNFAIQNSLVREYEDYPHEKDAFRYAFLVSDTVMFTGTNDTDEDIILTSIEPTADMVGREVLGTNVAPGSRVVSLTDSSFTLDRPTTGVATDFIIRIPVLKVLNIMADQTIQYQTLGKFSDRVILSNVYNVETDGLKYIDLKYVQEVVDPADFDPLFAEALILRLAAKMAPVMTATPGIANMLNNEYSAILRHAANIASEERVVEEADSWWTDRR